MEEKKTTWWGGVKEANTAISVLQRLLPGAVMTTIIGYLTHLWARFSHLLGVEQFVLVLCTVAASLLIWAAILVLWQYVTPRINVRLSAHVTPSSEVVISVHNEGSDGIFSAKAVATVPGLSKSPFQLAWQDAIEKAVPIDKGDSANLLVVTMQDEIKHELLKMTVWQLIAGVRQQFCISLWNVEPKEKLPNQLLRVTVRSSGKRGEESRYFLIRPETYVGPLKVLDFYEEEEMSVLCQ
jgi:hypothetical protein